jgi:hypothetical protein
VMSALSGDSALAMIAAHGLPHLAIVDLVMPGGGASSSASGCTPRPTSRSSCSRRSTRRTRLCGAFSSTLRTTS